MTQLGTFCFDILAYSNNTCHVLTRSDTFFYDQIDPDKFWHIMFRRTIGLTYFAMPCHFFLWHTAIFRHTLCYLTWFRHSSNTLAWHVRPCSHFLVTQFSHFGSDTYCFILIFLTFASDTLCHVLSRSESSHMVLIRSDTVDTIDSDTFYHVPTQFSQVILLRSDTVHTTDSDTFYHVLTQAQFSHLVLARSAVFWHCPQILTLSITF